ncbi:hypothetical protein LCGC14_1117460 [marine sediment metagenome]|uniref:Uncharacterized protein n=1 Tax=marine sediment metagenome TaxID=412755 RepID=A0A0F9M9S3_9ZZZZ
MKSCDSCRKKGYCSYLADRLRLVDSTCDASGWLEGRFEHPYGEKDTGADLVHKKNCPINLEIRKK